MDVGAPDREKAQEIIHDLLNALGLVINYATLVAKDLADRPEALKDLSEIEAAARRAADLTGDLAAMISAGERPC